MAIEWPGSVEDAHMSLVVAYKAAQDLGVGNTSFSYDLGSCGTVMPLTLSTLSLCKSLNLLVQKDHESRFAHGWELSIG